MRVTEKRLNALEARAPKEDESAWPWLRFTVRPGEPDPIIPARHNAIVRHIITPEGAPA